MRRLHSASQGGYKPFHPRNPLPDENWPYHHEPANGRDRQYGIHNPKFERHVFIRKDQVMADINMQLDMIAKTRRKPDGTEDDTFNSATVNYESQFMRWIDKHIGQAKAVMAAFTLEKFRTTKMNSISTTDEVDIELRMPEFWDDTTFEQLCQAVHDYIVNAVMHEYLALSLTSKDPVTIDKQQQADEALLAAKRYANAVKPGRVGKRFQPF